MKEGRCGGLNLGAAGEERAALALRLRGDQAALRRHFADAPDEVNRDGCR